MKYIVMFYNMHLVPTNLGAYRTVTIHIPDSPDINITDGIMLAISKAMKQCYDYERIAKVEHVNQFLIDSYDNGGV